MPSRELKMHNSGPQPDHFITTNLVEHYCNLCTDRVKTKNNHSDCWGINRCTLYSP